MWVILSLWKQTELTNNVPKLNTWPSCLACLALHLLRFGLNFILFIALFYVIEYPPNPCGQSVVSDLSHLANTSCLDHETVMKYGGCLRDLTTDLSVT